MKIILSKLTAWHWIMISIMTFTAILGISVAQTEYAIANGEDILLETLPVDPRDIMRGDYVTLRFKITADARIRAEEKNIHQYGDVFITYTKTPENIVEFKDVFSSEPNEPFIKGEQNSWRGISIGAEKFFVPEGKGLTIEEIDNLMLKAKKTKNGKIFGQQFYKDMQPINLHDIEAQSHR